MAETKSHLLFEDGGTSNTGRTLIAHVWAAGRTGYLGSISWYAPWRRYVFHPAESSLFDAECLFELAHELRRMMQAHKTKIGR